MSKAKKFIENIQGLLIYLKEKNRSTISLRALLEKDEDTFNFILEDFNENHTQFLEEYFKKQKLRDKGLLYASFIDTYQHFEANRPNASGDEFENELKETEKYYKELVLKLPSKFQDLDSFATVHYLLNELMEAAPLMGCTIPARPEIATVSTESVNACRKFGFFSQDFNVSFDERNWEKEFEADNIGMYLAMQVMARRGFLADFCYLGIEPFFIVQDIALRARKILKDGNEDISNEFRSHPPNLMRREKTRSELKKITPNDLYLDAIYMPDVINETMEYLWEKSKGIFYEEFQKKNKR